MLKDTLKSWWWGYLIPVDSLLEIIVIADEVFWFQECHLKKIAFYGYHQNESK